MTLPMRVTPPVKQIAPDAPPSFGSQETPQPERAEHAETRLVMCPPKYLSTRIPNNVWMKQEKVDVERALRQYSRIKNVLTALGKTVLEIPPVQGAQDQTYVANIGIALDPYIVIAYYKAPGRAIEVAPAERFFKQLGYQGIQPPYHFEGEADLKKLRDGVYFGGWGQFTEPKALDWIEEQTGIEIVRLHEVSDELYHLDCSIFVIDEENVLVTQPGLDKQSIKTVERYANVIMTPSGTKGINSTGITNGVKIPEKKVFLSGTFMPEMPSYRKAMEWVLKTFDQFGYTVILLDTDEADKSGADLSCMVMHLDFEPQQQQVVK